MIKDYYAEAVEVAETINAVMVSDMGLTPPVDFWLDTTAPPHIWLIAVLNPASLGGKINAYVNPQTRHQLSTALGGKPVFLSNHSGLRYGVLLSERPKLPFPVAYPDGLQALGSVPLGVTLAKKLHPQAATLMNVLVGGEQGSGKSGLMHLFAYSACQNGWKIYAADPRQMTFDETWNGLTLAPVASRANEVNDILAKMELEMDRRAELFRAVRFGGLPAGNIDVYNNVVGAEKALPRIFFLVDEANTFLADDRVEARVRDLSRQPRKFGMHFVLAAHDWRSDGGIPRGISANFHTRISLRVADDTSGTAVLGNPKMGKAMMRVTKPGRAIVFLDGRFARVQLYRLAEAQVVGMLTAGKPAPLLTSDERNLAARALSETDGKISREVLVGFGMSQTQALRMAETWTARGWAAKDPLRDNATYITPNLADLVNNPTTATTANNRQTTQTTGIPAFLRA